jgi:hypothetical protein
MDKNNNISGEKETEWLLSIPGMRESIIEGIDTPVEECLSLEDIGWDIETSECDGKAAEQAWYFSKEWQEAEKEADEDLKAGRVKTANNITELMDALNDSQEKE